MILEVSNKVRMLILALFVLYWGEISNAAAFTELSVDLYNYVGSSLSYTASGSDGYVIPTSSDMTIFNDCIDHFLNKEIDALESDCNGTGKDIYDINFKLLKIDDTGTTGEDVYCLEENASTQGQSFFCINYNSSKKHHVSTPHPKYDSNTNIEAVEVMRGTGARYLSISTAHRCTNSATTSCSGTTTACGVSGFFKVSDMSHNVDSYFHNFGVKVNDFDSSVITVQLHGCGSTNCPSNKNSSDVVARLSVGTTDNLGSNELVNRLKNELNDLLAFYSEGSVKSCNDSGDDADEKLCATANSLGRYINGETSSPCDTAATLFVGSRFLHIEQNSNLRNNGGDVNPALLIDALNSSIQGISVSSISGNTAEDGTAAAFTVKLDTAPDGNVVIDVESSDTGEGTVSPSILTFTPANWNSKQTVTVTGADDSIADGDQGYTIQLTISASSTTDTTGYASLDPDDVSIINIDSGLDNNSPSVPVLKSPLNGTGIAGSTIVFRWEKSYDPDFDTVSGLDTNTNYCWKVTADDGNGGTSESETWRFIAK